MWLAGLCYLASWVLPRTVLSYRASSPLGRTRHPLHHPGAPHCAQLQYTAQECCPSRYQGTRPPNCFLPPHCPMPPSPHCPLRQKRSLICQDSGLQQVCHDLLLLLLGAGGGLLTPLSSAVCCCIEAAAPGEMLQPSKACSGCCMTATVAGNAASATRCHQHGQLLLRHCQQHGPKGPKLLQQQP